MKTIMKLLYIVILSVLITACSLKKENIISQETTKADTSDNIRIYYDSITGKKYVSIDTFYIVDSLLGTIYDKDTNDMDVSYWRDGYEIYLDVMEKLNQ